MLQSSLDREMTPCRGAALGYSGAIGTGQTICGTLYAGAVFLGYLYAGDDADASPPSDPRRQAAIAAVRALFDGFVACFGSSDCQTLIGMDLSDGESLGALRGEFEQLGEAHGCCQQMRYVIETCLETMRELEANKNPF